jgi:predicted negative regulator of RcsB-dependent stress response
MVDEFSSDREQEEALRNWWLENWRWVLSGIALGIGALVGWRSWQTYRIEQAEGAAGMYRQVVEALGRDDQTAAGQIESDLESRYGSSAYTDQARLLMARALVEQQHYDGAAARLRTVADGSSDPELAMVATIRLARVEIEQGEPDSAIALLDPDKLGAFAALAHAVRGDAYAARGDKDAARREYEAALAAPPDDPSIDRDLITLKVETLGPAVATSAEAGS